MNHEHQYARHHNEALTHHGQNPKTRSPQDPQERADAATFPSPEEKSLRGCLKSYAKPELIEQEQEAWQAAIKEKYEHR